MKAEIITIGTELLLGEITDTNSQFIASQLPLLGIDVYFISTVGDNHQRLLETLRQAWSRSDLIITTGGLGPTEGDITRESIANLLNEELITNQEALDILREYFCHRKLDMPQTNLKQAKVIPSSKPILNNRGTAPGWWVEKEGHIIVALPGPPRELQYMWNNEVLPLLKQKTKGDVIVSRTLKLFGLGEAKIAEMISPYFSSSNPTLGIYAKRDGIHIRITAKAESRKRADALIDKFDSSLTEMLNPYIWGKDSDTLEDIISRILIKRNLSLSIMESETGGSLINIISSIPDASLFFKGGLIAPSNESKTAFGIKTELLSEYPPDSLEVAEEMATVIRGKLDTEIGIGITAVINDQCPNKNALGSIFIAINDGKIMRKFSRNSPGTMDYIKQRAAITVLFELSKILTSGGTDASHN